MTACVSAIMLNDEGYEVVGITMKTGLLCQRRQ
jgi:tRNA U34 2-thiouridine synthase MnmA/TrmU